VSGYDDNVNVATSRRSRAGVREVKNHLSAYLERVRGGEEIVITDRGRPIARLTGVEPDIDRIQALIDQGLLTPASAPRSLPSRRVRAKGPISELVADERR
jgi:prevent-host-death family protein